MSSTTVSGSCKRCWKIIRRHKADRFNTIPVQAGLIIFGAVLNVAFFVLSQWMFPVPGGTPVAVWWSLAIFSGVLLYALIYETVVHIDYYTRAKRLVLENTGTGTPQQTVVPKETPTRESQSKCPAECRTFLRACLCGGCCCCCVAAPSDQSDQNEPGDFDDIGDEDNDCDATEPVRKREDLESGQSSHPVAAPAKAPREASPSREASDEPSKSPGKKAQPRPKSVPPRETDEVPEKKKSEDTASAPSPVKQPQKQSAKKATPGSASKTPGSSTRASTPIQRRSPSTSKQTRKQQSGRDGAPAQKKQPRSVFDDNGDELEL